MTRIDSIPQLREAVLRGSHEFFIRLNFALKSSKTIDVGPDGAFTVVNGIDGTEQTLTEEQLRDRSLTNIGTAMERGAFWCCD
jgi:hypothetical protein